MRYKFLVRRWDFYELLCAFRSLFLFSRREAAELLPQVFLTHGRKADFYLLAHGSISFEPLTAHLAHNRPQKDHVDAKRQSCICSGMCPLVTYIYFPPQLYAKSLTSHLSGFFCNLDWKCRQLQILICMTYQNQCQCFFIILLKIASHFFSLNAHIFKANFFTINYEFKISSFDISFMS